MSVDLLLGAIVLLFGIMGFFSGAIRQIAHWAALACGALAASPLAARATPLIAPNLDLPAGAVRVVLSFFFFCALTAIVGAVLRRALDGVFRDHGGHILNRILGFALGVGKGSVVLFALISFLLFFEKPLTRLCGQEPDSLRTSAAVDFVRRCDYYGVEALPPAPPRRGK